MPPVQVDKVDSRLRVLYLGTVGRAQGLVSAVRAARLAQDAGTPILLRVVGDGAELAAVQAEAERLAAPVEVLPPVPASQVAAHYTWADSVLVSLQDWPAMGLTVPSKLYEVLGVGRHVSGAVAGEAAQVISDSGGGSVVPPQDPAALAALWSVLARDRSRLRVLGAGRWLAAHASPEVMVSRYEALLQEVARG
ncbi:MULTISPECIES: glycosyltransferase [Actinomyces]|uniref:glycosyltransferase n=1 Tax=Actinomyces TaxID=1654 RepID=UPI001FBB937F|nr:MULTISPECIES: glycosyltransferase [Actinomyces]